MGIEVDIANYFLLTFIVGVENCLAGGEEKDEDEKSD
jgi:hypothetical protein